MSEIDADAVKEIIRLVEVDHKATTEFIARVTTLRTAARSVVVPFGSALLGLSISNSSWILATASIPIVIVGAIIEAKSDFILNLSHSRLLHLERNVQAYVTSLAEKEGPLADEANKKLYRTLDAYQFGMSRSLRGAPVRKTLAIAIRTAIFWLYVALTISLIVAAIIIGVSDPKTSEKASSCLRSSSGSVAEIHELPIVRAGQLELVACP